MGGLRRRGRHGVAGRGAAKYPHLNVKGVVGAALHSRSTASATPPTSPGAGQGRAPARRAHLREHQGDRASGQAAGRRHGRRHGGGRSRAPTSSSTAPACGRASSAAWPASTCRCMPASISMSSRSEPGASAQSAGAARAGRVRLLQGGRRQAAARRLRAGASRWGMDGMIPEDCDFDQLPEDLDHFEPILEMASERMPMLKRIGHPHLLQRPRELHARRPLLSRRGARALRNFFVAAGYNSIGIQTAGGAGMALAQWMDDGEPPFDLWDVDIRRGQPFQSNATYLTRPRQRDARPALCRPFSLSPARDARAACAARRCTSISRRAAPVSARSPAGSAPTGSCPRRPRTRREGRVPLQLEAAELVRHTSARSTWRCATASACSTCRRSARSASRAATRRLSCSASAPTTSPCAPGRIVYTQWLNRRGGIEGDLTVARLSDDVFLVVTSSADAAARPRLAETPSPDGAALRGNRRHRRRGVPRRHGAAFARALAPLGRYAARQRRIPVRHVARDRDRLCGRPRAPHHLCRRARLGALRPGRHGAACVRHA